MSGIALLAGLTAGLGWTLMIAVGILRSVGAVDWSLSYDESVALIALLALPWLVIASTLVVSVRNSSDV